MAQHGGTTEQYAQGYARTQSEQGVGSEKYRGDSEESSYRTSAGPPLSPHGASSMLSRQLPTLSEYESAHSPVAQQHLSTIPSAYRTDFDPNRIEFDSGTPQYAQQDDSEGGRTNTRTQGWNEVPRDIGFGQMEPVVLRDSTTGQYYYDTARPPTQSRSSDSGLNLSSQWAESSSTTSHSSIYVPPPRPTSSHSVFSQPPTSSFHSTQQYYYSVSTSSRLPPARLHFLPSPLSGPTPQQLETLRPGKESIPHHLSPGVAPDYRPPPQPPGLLRSFSSPFPHSRTEARPAVFPIPLLPTRSRSVVTQSFLPPTASRQSISSASPPPRSSLGLSFSDSSTVGQLLGAVSTSAPRPKAVARLVVGPEPDAPPPIKPFASKLMIMLNSIELYGDYIRWNPSGSFFVVALASKKLTSEVLPLLFSHSSLQSFQRQLNIYGFKHVSPADVTKQMEGLTFALPLSDYSGYEHPYFQRDDQSELHLMTPTPSRARALKKREGDAANAHASAAKRVASEGRGRS